MFSIFGFEIFGPVILLGIITGMTYGILAVGLALIYRSNRIINFAHGEIGAVGAAVLGVVVVKWKVPFWAAFPFVITMSAGIGALSEVAVVRRLKNSPNIMSIVATLGLAQFILIFSFVINAQAGAGRLYPQPSGLPEFDVGALRVTKSYFAMLVLTPLVVAGLVVFLRKSWYGVAIRGAAANPEAARMSGVFPGRMSTMSWAIAGAVSAFTAILITPTRGFVTVQSLGPSLLLRALVPAVIGRMSSLPVAFGAGIAVGVVEQELLWNTHQGGLVEVILFVAILVALLFQHRQTARDEEKGSWARVSPWPPLPDAFRNVWTIRNLGMLTFAVAFAGAIALGFTVTNAAAIILIAIVAFALVGLSIGVITGLAGQLSLGQFALAGIGAAASYHTVLRTGNYLFGFIAAGLAAAAVSVVIGIPALRIRGLMLAVTTLSFALAAQAWLFSRPQLFGDGVDPGRPIIGSIALTNGRAYYLFSLIFLAAGLLLTRNVWRSGLGRRLRALRDNEDGARAFTVRSTMVKLQSFALAGFLAGLGGAVFGHALSRVSSTAFPVDAGINVVALTVLGGIGILAGPIIGALYIIGVPTFLPLDNAGLAAQKFGWLFLILYFPGGIAQMIRPAHERVIDWLARRAGIDPATARETGDTVAVVPPALEAGAAAAGKRVATGEVLLEIEHLSKRYGGVQAVDDVGFSVRAGETVGLIGPNGAGKTTLFELLGGFTPPDGGRVIFTGRDVGSLGPEARGRLGLIRSFQDASLFPTLTVLETVTLSLERADPTRFLRSVLGFRGAERRKEVRARELITLMGLDAFRSKRIIELSTGTRRITELACLVALDPELLLLDEPASGIAQRETEALGDVLRSVKAYLGCTMLIIEHDIPMIMALADRVIAMESGRIIADADPQSVRTDPAVIESYLGGDIRAIERSGTAQA